MFEETNQSLWNFDGAEAQVIFELKSKFIIDMNSWNLEDAFWTLRTLRMEIDAKLSRGKHKLIEEQEQEQGKQKAITEKEEMDNKMESLEKERVIYLQNIKDRDKKIHFFIILEEFYMHICYIMKKHGLYFREGEEHTLAVLKR